MEKTYFKYLDWTKPYVKNSLKNSTLFFSNNFSFNDPFDLQLPILLDIEARNNWFIREDEKHLGRKLKGNEIDNILEFLDANRDILKQGEKDWKNNVSKVREIEDKMGILCLSKLSSSVIMWGHYANSHSGICVGYNFERLIKFLKTSFGQRVKTYEVKYSSEIPTFDSMKMEEKEYQLEITNKRFSTKHMDWQYEKEVRILIANFARKSIKIPVDIVSEVILGYKIQALDIAEITTLCKTTYPHIRMYNAVPNKSSFKMDIIQIKE